MTFLSSQKRQKIGIWRNIQEILKVLDEVGIRLKW